MKVSNLFAASGKFVTVTFVKNDGTIRKINGRVGVKKYLRGGNDRSTATKEKYLLLWTRNGSPKFDAARNIARDRIISIRANGVELKRNDESDFSNFV